MNYQWGDIKADRLKAYGGKKSPTEELSLFLEMNKITSKKQIGRLNQIIGRINESQ